MLYLSCEFGEAGYMYCSQILSFCYPNTHYHPHLSSYQLQPNYFTVISEMMQISGMW